MTKKRRDQFTFKTSRMSDEVYDFFENLSKSHQLTKFVIQAAEEQIRSNKGKSGFEQEVLAILNDIKSAISTRKIQASTGKDSDTMKTPVMPVVQLSGEEKRGALDQEDMEYGDW